MKINYRYLGEFIEEQVIKNHGDEKIPLLGIRKKEFSRHRDDLPNDNLKDCKIIQKNQFCYVPVTSRNGERISISFLQEVEKALVSKTYVVFQIKDTKIFDPNYLMMWFRKKEFDRYARWNSFGSQRETFSWKSLCNFWIPIVSIEKQNQLIKELGSLDKHIQIRKKISEKLRELIVSYKRFFHNPEFEKKLKENIKLISRNNKNNEVRNAVGIGWKKDIVDYGSIIRNNDYSKLQILEKDDFVYKKDIDIMCCLSCWLGDKPTLVSGSYQAFRIVDKSVLTVGYLMACFLDPEFDRYALYHAFGSSRDKFKPPQFLNFKVSFIDPEIQKLFNYLYELYLINEKIIFLAEKRLEIVLENFEYLLQD